MIQQTVSKSQFKAKALEYLREVEKGEQLLIITHAGKPVVQVTPFKEKTQQDPMQSLQGTLVFYKDPDEPVGLEDWEALK